MGSCGRAELRIGHLGIWVKAGEGKEWRRVERRLKEEREELKHKGDAESGNADGFWCAWSFHVVVYYAGYRMHVL